MSVNDGDEFVVVKDGKQYALVSADLFSFRPLRGQQTLQVLLDMTGESTIELAIEHVRAERIRMVELYDRNKILRLFLKKLWPIIAQTEKVFLKIVETSAMFLPPSLLGDLYKLVDLVDEAEIAHAKLN